MAGREQISSENGPAQWTYPYSELDMQCLAFAAG
jgi:hypothetical protein